MITQAISPLWRDLVQERRLTELAELGVTVEINEDGIVRAAWVPRSNKTETAIIVKLELLLTRDYGQGWAASGMLRDEGGQRILIRQLKASTK